MSSWAADPFTLVWNGVVGVGVEAGGGMGGAEGVGRGGASCGLETGGGGLGSRCWPLLTGVVTADVARLKGGRVVLREGREGAGSADSAMAADARQLKLREDVTVGVAGAGGKMTELFLPTVARTFETASVEVDAAVGVELSGAGVEGVVLDAAAAVVDKVGSDGRLW